MDFHRYRALTGSRLKFWTVPQGLKIHRTLTVLWNPELLLEAVWTVALWTQDPHRASSAKLGDAIQGLVIPKSRILDPEPGVTNLRHRIAHCRGALAINVSHKHQQARESNAVRRYCRSNSFGNAHLRGR